MREWLPAIVAWMAFAATAVLYLLTRDAIHKAPDAVRKSELANARERATRDNGA